MVGEKNRSKGLASLIVLPDGSDRMFHGRYCRGEAQWAGGSFPFAVDGAVDKTGYIVPKSAAVLESVA
jgi:hypothetical protein